MALDLGSIITTLGGQYINTRWGQVPETLVDTRNPLGGGGGYVVPQGGVGTDQVPLRTQPVFYAQAGSLLWKLRGVIGGLGLGLAADEIATIAGAVKGIKCKRRRRRLATHSDIKDLAALSAVLGKGKLLETWVATRRI